MKIVFRWLVVAVLCAGIFGGWWMARPPATQAQGGAAWTVSVFGNPDLAGSPPCRRDEQHQLQPGTGVL